jgi:hypothetical protein
MGSEFPKALKQAVKYPVLLIVSGAVALFCFAAFIMQALNLFSIFGWFADMLVWYLGDIGIFFGDLGDIFGNGLYLLSYFFYTLQFLGTFVLVGLLFGFATGILRHSKTTDMVLIITAVVAAYMIGPLYELFSGFPLFSGPVWFLYHLHNILPMNLAALVTVVFLLLSVYRKKTARFSLYLYIVGGIQLLFAVFQIIGSIFIAPVQFIDLLIWLINLISPILFVFMGCMVEEQLTGQKVPYVGKVIDAVNSVRFETASAAQTPVSQEQSIDSVEEKTDSTLS